jgi:hypothetical protein
MALNVDDVQSFLGGTDGEDRSEFRSDSGYVGRCWIDGTLVVYDLMDVPMWLAAVLKRRDELADDEAYDGDTDLAEPRVALA